MSRQVALKIVRKNSAEAHTEQETPVAAPVKAKPVTLRPTQIVEKLEAFLSKTQVAELRGRKPRPDILITKGEHQALESAISLFKDVASGKNSNN